MSTTDITPETPETSKPITARTVRRRMERIRAMADARKARKRKAKLADAILVGIASGKVGNPGAVARAFVDETELTGAAATSDDLAEDED